MSWLGESNVVDPFSDREGGEYEKEEGEEEEGLAWRVVREREIDTASVILNLIDLKDFSEVGEVKMIPMRPIRRGMVVRNGQGGYVLIALMNDWPVVMISPAEREGDGFREGRHRGDLMYIKNQEIAEELRGVIEPP